MPPLLTLTEEETASYEFVPLIELSVSECDDASYEIRPLWGPDLDDSFVATMECLAPVAMNRDQLVKVFNQRLKSGIWTFVAIANTKVIGTASLHVLPKMTHQGHPAGLIEDVVVRENLKHRGLGMALVQRCIDEAHKHGCYRITLNCKAELVSFFAQAGFTVNGACMRIDLEVPKESVRNDSSSYST